MLETPAAGFSDILTIMRRSWGILLIVCFLAALPLAAEKVTVYRDEFGTPHIYAETIAGMSYAAGYAQAEDRLEEMLKNYRKATGTMAEAFGQEYFLSDYRQRLWRHAAVSREKYSTLSTPVRLMAESFIAGVKQYMKEHPQEVPAWAPPLEPWLIAALSRYIIYGWPEGEAMADLRRGGVPLEMPNVYRGSNQWLVSGKRTALGVPFAVIDPHLSWYGEFRFYEMRMYAGESKALAPDGAGARGKAPDFALSGAAILGLPFPSLGHTRWISVAMTTGGPDTSDVFEEELNPANPKQYKRDGQWVDMTVRHEKIGVKAADGKVESRDVEIDTTVHGPVVAHKDGKAYAVAIPYAEQVGLLDQSYKMVMAHNLDEMKSALSMLQLMAQNIMVGTVQGDIFYVRNGRVPIRAAGVDPSKPIPGSTSANDWKGIHPFADLVQITNPPQGYMQNNNTTPFGMMKDSPLTPESAKTAYLYNDTRRPNHQRAATTMEELAAEPKLTLERAMEIAFSTSVYKAETWQERIRKVSDGAAGEAHNLAARIIAWNRRLDADSTGAMDYRAFKMALARGIANQVTPPDDLTDAQVGEALAQGAKQLLDDYGTLDVAWGKLFRVGRQGAEPGRTWPVGGGSLQDLAMAVPRAISFSPQGKEMVGHTGQTSTQLVILSNPPKSWSVIPLGESDHPASGHFDDQAEKLFSKSKMKSTYF